MGLHGNHPVVKEDDLHLGMALLIHITRSGGASSWAREPVPTSSLRAFDRDSVLGWRVALSSWVGFIGDGARPARLGPSSALRQRDRAGANDNYLSKSAL